MTSETIAGLPDLPENASPVLIGHPSIVYVGTMPLSTELESIAKEYGLEICPGFESGGELDFYGQDFEGNDDLAKTEHVAFYRFDDLRADVGLMTMIARTFDEQHKPQIIHDF